jgi:creatinine amidohydrolase
MPASMTDAGVAVAASPWPLVAARLAAGAVAVLPIGAGAKEHGYHLPLATDYIQAEWLAGELRARRAAVTWPTLSYGYYPVFVDYPGSISLTRGTFCALVREVLSGIVQAGARRVAVVNTGISTIEPLAEVLRGFDPDPPMRLINVYSGARFAAARAAIEEQPWGGHADEIETAIMLALAPQSVDMRCAFGNAAPIVRGKFNRHDPLDPNYSPTGVNGDPRRATAAKGVRLLAALIEDTLAALDEATGPPACSRSK